MLAEIAVPGFLGRNTTRTPATADPSSAEAVPATSTFAVVAAGDDSRLVRVPGGHMEHLDPRTAAADALRAALARVIAGDGGAR